VSVVDGAVVTCDDRRAALSAMVEPVIAAADRSCLSDSDCDNVGDGTGCSGNGCPLNYVSKKAANEIRALLKRLGDQYCPDAYRAGCDGEGEHGCPLIVFPACVNGMCQGMPIMDTQPDGASP
jgi:hypothetical protein